MVWKVNKDVRKRTSLFVLYKKSAYPGRKPYISNLGTAWDILVGTVADTVADTVVDILEDMVDMVDTAGRLAERSVQRLVKKSVEKLVERRLVAVPAYVRAVVPAIYAFF